MGEDQPASQQHQTTTARRAYTYCKYLSNTRQEQESRSITHHPANATLRELPCLMLGFAAASGLSGTVLF